MAVFELYTVTHYAARPGSLWSYLSVQFNPDWHQHDEDEMLVSNALNWLEENVIWHHLSQQPCYWSTPVDRRFGRTTFYVHVYDAMSAMMFRLRFPMLRHVTDELELLHARP